MTYSIFTDIDTVLDTRLIVAMTIDFKSTIRMLESGEYHDRVRDQIGIIPYDLFRAFYAKRSKSVLEHAAPCKILGIVRDYYTEAMSDMKNVAEVSTKYILYLNTYPYHLDDEEIDNLKKYIGLFIPGVDIRNVNKSIREITPEWISEHIQTMILYDGPYWAEYWMANKELINHPVVHCGMLAPAIITQNSYGNKITPKHFIEFQDMFRGVIELTVLPAHHFSGVVTEDIMEDEEQEEQTESEKE